MKVNPVSQMEEIQKRDSEIYFCDNSKKLSILELKDIPKEKMEIVQRLHKLEDRHNVRILYFLTIWAVAAFTMITVDLLPVQILSCFAIVYSMTGCSTLMHEASHRLLFKSPFLNQWVGFLCGLPVLIPVSGFRTNHGGHHVRRSSRKGPDDIVTPIKNSSPSVFTYYIYVLLKTFGFIYYMPFIAFKYANRKVRIITLTEYVLFIGFFLLVFWAFPTDAVLKIWFYPFLIVAVLAEIRAVAEHGLTTRGNVFTATRTVISNRFVSFMMCNINYHLEHHLFPRMPWYNLPKVHRILQNEYRRAGCSVYSSYTAFFIDFFKTSWAGFITNARLIPKVTREAISG